MNAQLNLIPDQDIPPDQEIPMKTEWYVSCNCCRTPCLKLKDDRKRRIFWGFLELHVGMAILVMILVLFPPAIYFIFSFSSIPLELQISSAVTIIIFFIMFVWSYFGASCMDPGFLPYDWIQTQKYVYSWQDQLSGLAIRQDQVNYALDNRPKFASFSRSSGRFVIRADHICFWINNWVGKRNHKQFILMGLWGGLYSLVLLAWQAYASFKFKNSVFTFIGMAFELAFGILLIYVFIQNLIDVRANTTKIQKYKHQSGQKYGFCKSMREVFGNDCFGMWLLPTPAFDENMIIEEDEIPQEAPEPME